MVISFISISVSNNNFANAKMLQLAILKKDGEEVVAEFQNYIKPFPRLTPSEKQLLVVSYAEVKTASPLCDLASEIIAIIENSHTIFMDKFSESVFKKAFKSIGYPVGSATYLLDKLFKSTLKQTIPFQLTMAMEILKVEYPLKDNLDKCRAMDRIFMNLQYLRPENFFLLQAIPKKNENGIDLNNLPRNPGVYFFRNEIGEVIYVGKAKNIALRVRNHFSSKLKFERELCRNTYSVDFEETGSETIALLLETHYINQLKPTENTMQKDIIDPYIITSQTDSKGILRIKIIQKSYEDSENEFYYNRVSVLEKVGEIQKKFNLCRRFTGIEKTASRCSDTVHCNGICEGLEKIEDYNSRVKEGLAQIFREQPSYILRLNGRNSFEKGLILVKNGIYHGFGFIDVDSTINSLEDMESFVKPFAHNYFTSRILDQYFKNTKNATENLINLSNQ